MFMVIFAITCMLTVLLVLISFVFSYFFIKTLRNGGSDILPVESYQGIVFGAKKAARQNIFAVYFLSRKYEMESRDELRKMGRIGRVIWIFCITGFCATAVILLGRILVNTIIRG